MTVPEGENEANLGTLPSRIIPSHGNGSLTPIRTSERGRELAAARWGWYRKLAAAGSVIGALGPDVAPTKAAQAQAYIELVAVQARMANDLSDPRAPQAFRNVRQAIGADIGAPSRDSGDAPETGMTLHISDSAAARVAEVLAAAMRSGK